ncbi:MAG: hypothetical protein IKG66_04530, partial [Lachnospiraceae bacterium]|nr:hypothetical protein [Lachnospiraceae bacterium]
LDKDVGKTESSISSKLDAISGKISRSFGYQVLKDIGGAFINMGKEAVQGFASISKAALESTASLEQNIGGVETLFGSSAQTVIANAEKAYQTAGMSANTYMETVTSFSASLLQSLDGDTAKAAAAANQAIIDMSDNANKMGTDIAAIQNAYQDFAKQNYTMLDNLKLGYGGTKQEMERLLEDASKLSGIEYDISNLNDVYEAIHVIQGEIGITGTTAAEAASTIEGSMSSAKAAWDNFLNGSISGEELVAAFMTAGENIATNMVTIVQGFADQLPGIVDAVATKLPGLIETLGPPMLDAFVRAASTLVQVGGKIIKYITDGIQKNLPQITTSAANLLTQMINGITAAAPGLIQSAVTIVTTLVSGISQNLPQILTSAGQLVMTLAQGLISSIPQLVGSALQLITSLASFLIQNAPQILQAGVTLIGQLAAGLIQAIPQIATAAGNIITEAKNKFTSVDWGSVGKAIVDGLVNGLKGAGHLLWDAAKGLARNALDGAKKALHIGSPSKVFRDEVGKMIPAGMALGIDDGTGEVEDSMDSLTDRMLRGFTADVNYNLPNLSSYAEDLGATISATGATQINVPLYMDGREVARATARFTNE